jgi:hypothetical protein
MAKKKDETAPAVTCFEIAHQVSAVAAKIIDQGGELKEGDLESLQQWQAALEVKAENICHLLTRLESEEAYYKAVEEAANRRRKARESARNRLREYLLNCMATADTRSIKKTDGLFSVTAVDGHASVHIQDVGKIPFELVDVVEVITPKKKEILAKLQAGEEIPGATLEYGAPYLMIR